MEAHNVARMGASGLGNHPISIRIGQVVKFPDEIRRDPVNT
jgi:hypothetical protein